MPESKREEVERLLGDLIPTGITIDRILSIVEELERRATEAEANYRFMVEKAADKSLAGYRGLGQRAADAENLADDMRMKNKDLERENGELKAAVEKALDEHEATRILKARIEELKAELAALKSRGGECVWTPTRWVDEFEISMWERRCDGLQRGDREKFCSNCGKPTRSAALKGKP